MLRKDAGAKEADGPYPGQRVPYFTPGLQDNRAVNRRHVSGHQFDKSLDDRSSVTLRDCDRLPEVHRNTYDRQPGLVGESPCAFYDPRTLGLLKPPRCIPDLRSLMEFRNLDAGPTA